MQKLYDSYIGNFDSYLEKVNLALTEVGTKQQSLALTETRVSSQQVTIKELKSTNEDREISDIILDYTAAYNAYQASLQAGAKINQNTLLNYI
jgi:flagellar hook-associated protein 3 FlgL